MRGDDANLATGTDDAGGLLVSGGSARRHVNGRAVGESQEDVVLLLPGTSPLGRAGASLATLVAVALAVVGTQFAWATTTAFSTPILKMAHASQREISYLRLPGPVTGLVVQPVTGVIGDAIGRRGRPIFLAIGAALTIAGLGVFPLGPSVACAFAGLWLIDTGVNAMDASMRAVAADVSSRAQRTQANGAVASCLGVGQILGFLVGSLDLTEILRKSTGYRTDLSDLQLSCAFGAALTAACVAVSLSAIWRRSRRKRTAAPPSDASSRDSPDEDAPLARGTQSSRSSLTSPWDVLRGIRTMRPWMRKVCFLNGMSWCGWFFFLLFASDWMAHDIYGGDPQAPEGAHERRRYEEGQKAASLALALNAAVVVPAGLLAPRWARAVGLQGMLVALNAALAAALGGCSLLGRGQVVPAVLLVAALGVPWALTMTVPYSFVARLAPPSQRGTLLGVLNIFVV